MGPKGIAPDRPSAAGVEDGADTADDEPRTAPCCGARNYRAPSIKCQARGPHEEHLWRSSDGSWGWHWPLTHAEQKAIKRRANRAA